MHWYKVIDNETFIGVATSYDLRRHQRKHNILLSCDENLAQYIQVDGKKYHAQWMLPEFVKGLYPTVDVVEIDEEEYNLISSAIEKDEVVIIEKNKETVVEEPIKEEVLTPNVTVSYLKEVKIKEMSAKCQEEIMNGIDVVLSDGKSHHFSLQITDQLMIDKLVQKAKNGESDLIWHEDGGLSQIYSATDILLIGKKMDEHITYHTVYFNSLKAYIKSFRKTTKVMDIFYGLEIPAKYQTDVYKKLNR